MKLNIVKILRTAFILMALADFTSAKAVAPMGDSDYNNSDFEVYVKGATGDWNRLPVYPVKVDEVKDARHNVRTSSMSYFDMDGESQVKIVSKHNIDKAKIQPVYNAPAYDVKNDTILLTLTQPKNLVVTVNDDIFHNLHLFANPKDNNKPSKKELRKKKTNLIYFAPGVHQLDGDTLRIPSGATVYVSEGARVLGTLIVDDARDVKIFGRGEVHPKGRGEGIYIKRSRNIDVEGVIVTQIPVGESDSVRISNVKSISSYGWGDGMNVFASDNVTYDGVFCRNSDDCSTVYATRKGFNGGCRNIMMKNSTLWADVAHPIMIGLHGNAEKGDTIQNVRYENIDILDHCENQIDYQGCFAINCGDNNLVKDVVFDNIRVEDFRKGQLVNIRIFYNKKYCAAPGTGIHGVLFKDITYNGNNANLSIISGYDENRKVSDITFDNLVINGVKIHDNMEGKPKWYKTSDFAKMFVGEHVDNITFK